MGSGLNDANLTNKDVFNAADKFLKALDASPTGSGTVLKDHASKDWMETSVLRALSKLDAASYHCSNVTRLVQGAHEKAKALTGAMEYPTKTKLKPTKIRVAGTFTAQEIAFEIDAFLAAARASIDLGGAVLALHLGMNRRTSIIEVLKSIKKAPKSPFAILLEWAPWIEVLKKYRDECVHYRALRTQTGYEAVRRKGVLAVAILPLVIPQEIRHDQLDTRAVRFGMYSDDDSLPEGLDKSESWGEATMADGSTQVLGHSISYSPSGGYIRVEEFCAQHIEKLREFLVHVFEETPKAKFKFQNQA
jgi:hypothetical protein